MTSFVAENNIKKINLPALLWDLLGPLLVACALIVIGFRGLAAFWELPLLGVGGIFCCYQWKWRGMLLGSALLLAALAYRLSAVSSSEWLWLIVLSLTFVSAFVVSVLAMEESALLWKALYKEVEDQKNLAQIWHERAQNAQDKSQADHLDSQAKIDRLYGELSAKQERLQASEKLIGLVRDELTAMHAHHEKLLQELFEARQQTAQLENGFHEKTVQATVDETALEESRHLLTAREQEIEELKVRLENSRQQIERYINEQSTLHEARGTAENQTARLQEEQLRQQRLNEEQEQHIERLTLGKQQLEISLGALQNELEETHKMQKAEMEILQAECQTVLLAKEQDKQSLEQLDKLHNGLMCDMERLTREKQQLEMTMSTLQNELEASHKQQKAQMESLQAECQTALLAKEQDKQSLEQLVKLHEELKTTIDAKPLYCENRDIRRLQGLYQQLREQFAQKSATLDETRKQLFHVQERVLAREREADQQEGMEVQPLIHLIAAAEKEFALQESIYEQEINSLQAIVTKLLEQNTNRI